MSKKESKSETLLETTYRNLRKDINERRLQPGEKINIKDLSERYGVSETPVKQALNRLITEGLIENTPRKGMKIKEITWEEIEEVLDIRLMIETFYIKEVILTVKSNKAMREKLENNIKEHMEVIEKCDEVDTHIKNYALDKEFHELFLKCTGNKKLVEMYNNLNSHLYSNYIFKRQSKEKSIAGVNEHKEILSAMLDEDEEKLKEKVTKHIVNAKEVIYLTLKVDRI